MISGISEYMQLKGTILHLNPIAVIFQTIHLSEEDFCNIRRKYLDLLIIYHCFMMFSIPTLCDRNYLNYEI